MSNLIPFNDIKSMATAIANSRMFGQTAEQMLALMLIAQAEGRHPAIVARDYYVIQGRPTLKADAMLARFQEAGGRIQWHELNENKAEATFSHPIGGEVRLSWTLEMAKKAGLVKQGGPWHQYPRAMLRSRLISEGIRTVYPAAVCGVYTPEEAVDIPPIIEEKHAANESRVIEAVTDECVNQDDVNVIQNFITENESHVIEAVTDERINQDDVNVIQNFIKETGLGTERVLSWVKKVWHVDSFADLTQSQARRLLDKLETWSTKEAVVSG